MTPPQRVLIVVPPEDVEAGLDVRRKVIYPVEPAIAAEALRRAGHPVAGLDLNLAAAQGADVAAHLRSVLAEQGPDVVLIMSQLLTFLVKDQLEVIGALLAVVRQACPAAAVVAAGTTPTVYPEAVLALAGAPEVVFRGEIEAAAPRVVGSARQPGRLGGLAGACFRDNGRLHIAAAPAVVEHLDDLPIAKRDIFPLAPYFDHPEVGNLRFPARSRRFTQTTLSRGCRTGCRFCKVGRLRRGYRWRGQAHILDELRRLTEHHGIEEIHFLDENLLLNKARLGRLLARLRADGPRFDWFCGGGMAVYMLDERLLADMRATGCYRLHLAVESGSQRVLTEVMGKPVRLERLGPLLCAARQMDFEIVGYFMIGLPGETRAEIERTVALARDPRFDYVVFSIYTPEAGTPLYEDCRRRGLLAGDRPLHTLSKRAASNLTYPDFDGDYLRQIRHDTWREINFADPVRKARIETIFGGPVA